MRASDRFPHPFLPCPISARHVSSWLLVAALAGFGGNLFGQAEVNITGGLRGIRSDGDLVPVTTGLRAIGPDHGPLNSTNTDQEKLASPQYARDIGVQTLTGRLTATSNAPAVSGGRGNFGPGLTARIIYENTGPGQVHVDVQITAVGNNSLAGVYYFIHFPGEGPGGATKSPTSVYLAGLHRSVQIDFTNAVEASVQGRPNQQGFDAYFPISTGDMTNGQTTSMGFRITAACDVDKTPVGIAIDFAHPGSPFEGIGGNFRLQNQYDAPVIQYNLDHLDSAWARVAMPLDQWQPDEKSDPLAPASTGRIDDAVRQTLEMARTLSDRKIPLIISLWAPPGWAVLPPVDRPPGAGGGRTSHLNPAKWDHIAASIGSYLIYLKTNYGVEPKLFSFNESDIGYNVLQTPQEHADAIKRLGAWFAAHGLTTKMLLGDTGDPTGINFINAAMADPAAVKYLGAVSYHAWRGGTVEQYTRWGEAARKLNLPLIIAEGGTDSDAYRYPLLMAEPWYALNEIGEYVDICRWSQPAAILEWQFTSDYSLLQGGGRGGQPLLPTQRFWQLKQLSLTPRGAMALPVRCDASGLSICAFGDPAKGTCAIHLVNTGATREVGITGVPAGIKSLRAYHTDTRNNVREDAAIPVSNGGVHLTLVSMSYTTLIASP